MNKEKLFFEAIRLGILQNVQKFIKEDKDIVDIYENRTGCTPLVAAIENNRLEVAKELVKEGADIDDYAFAECCTPIFIAAEIGWIECVRFLLTEGADVEKVCDNEDSFPLATALDNNNLKTARLLLLHGANPNSKVTKKNLLEGELRMNPYRFNLNNVELLLQFGARGNVKDICSDAYNHNSRLKDVEDAIRRFTLSRAVEASLAFFSLEIPLYELFFILEWLPRSEHVLQNKLVAHLQRLKKSIQCQTSKKVYNLRPRKPAK